MDIDPHTKDRRWSESYNADDSAFWHDAMADSTLSGSSVPSQLLDKCEVFSNFGDNECGEPFMAQHLVFDFTPNPEIDTIEEQEKCIAFWNFVETQPILQQLCVKPKPLLTAVPKAGPTIKPEVINDSPALELLDRNSRNFMKCVIGDKKIQTDCSLEADSYSENDPTIMANSVSEPSKSLPRSMCTCTSKCSKCKKNRRKTKKADQETAKELNKILDEWDEQHPKSMEPPGPLMQLKPILQRRLPLDQEPKTCFD